MFTMGGPIRNQLPNPGSVTTLCTLGYTKPQVSAVQTDTELLKCTKIMYRHPSTYLHRSSGTGRGTSRHYPGPQRSPPGPGCTPACCSRPVGHPQHLGQGRVAGLSLEQWSQDSDPYSSDCSYSPWGAPGTAGQPPTR